MAILQNKEICTKVAKRNPNSCYLLLQSYYVAWTCSFLEPHAAIFSVQHTKEYYQEWFCEWNCECNLIGANYCLYEPRKKINLNAIFEVHGSWCSQRTHFLRLWELSLGRCVEVGVCKIALHSSLLLPVWISAIFLHSFFVKTICNDLQSLTCEKAHIIELQATRLPSLGLHLEVSYLQVFEPQEPTKTWYFTSSSESNSIMHQKLDAACREDRLRASYCLSKQLLM